MNTTEYLDAYKAAKGIPSDYGLAKALGVPRQTVSGWRTGVRQPDNMTCFHLAEALGLPRDQVIAAVEFERAQRTGNQAEADTWRGWLEKLGGVAASLAAAVILTAGFAPTNANAGGGLEGGQGVEPDKHRRGSRTRRRGKGHQAMASIADVLTGRPAVLAA